MPPKGGSTKLAPPRLPPLPKLRVRRPNKPGENPCVGIMTSVLGIYTSASSPTREVNPVLISLFTGCWASSGNAAAGCQQLEQSLRACMDAPVRLLCPPFLLDMRNWRYVGQRMERSNADLCRDWMEQRPKTGKKNTINYHLMRLYPKIKGPTKQGK